MVARTVAKDPSRGKDRERASQEEQRDAGEHRDAREAEEVTSPPSTKLLDAKGWGLLKELQLDARLSFAELGRRVGLSTPAVAERVRNLEAAGVITAYRAELDLKKLGLPMLAMIRISAVGDVLPRITHR